MLLTENISLFKNLNKEEKEEILISLPKPQAFKKGDIIYSDNNFPNALGIVVKGKAFAVTNNGQALFMQSFCEGSIFGAAAIFGGGDSYVSTIIAKTDIKVLFLTESFLKELFIKFPQASLNYISFLSEKVRFLNKKLSLVTSGNAEDTLMNYLKLTVDNCGFAEIPESKTQFAKMLNLSRASLYRALDNLGKQGLIEWENNKIKVIKNEKNC